MADHSSNLISCIFTPMSLRHACTPSRQHNHTQSTSPPPRRDSKSMYTSVYSDGNAPKPQNRQTPSRCAALLRMPCSQR
ncbi:hypothetical protein CPB85DRAFT_1324184 [Mucidula mucida]|nr:hypothetical protein CPB85DRAFT_1324184 [Mucidula mucida]